MYVCVCKAVSDKRIQREVDSGAISLRQLKERTDLGTCCGKCVHSAKQVLMDAMARRNLMGNPVCAAA